MIFDTTTIIICAVLVLLALLSSFTDTFFKKIHANKDATEPTGRKPVSVIIVADNNADELRANLPAFLSQDYDPGYEVIVVVEKDEDGTSDVLKAYSADGRLYTTAVPDSSRYMSRRKLAITLGVKAAKNELILLTDATCRPVSDKWISSMSSMCADGVDMVLGYSNYSDDTSRFKVFYRFHREYALLREASAGTAYGLAGNNVMFRKGMFMAGNGFQGNLKYLRGEYDFLVNKYAKQCNTVVNIDADGRLAECAPSKKAWHNKNIFYVETRRHLSRSAMHRLRFNLDMSSLYACLLSAVCSAAWAAVSGAWLILPFSFAALLAPLAVRTLNAKRAMGVFGVDVPLWKVFPFETDIIWHNLKYAINYKFADKYEFISHKS